MSKTKLDFKANAKETFYLQTEFPYQIINLESRSLKLELPRLILKIRAELAGGGGAPLPKLTQNFMCGGGKGD